MLPVGRNSFIFGSTTGRSFSGTVYHPGISFCSPFFFSAHTAQKIIGIGGPQYRCREISQSRKRYVVFFLPPSAFVILTFATAESMPSYTSELTNTPCPVYGSSSTILFRRRTAISSAVSSCASGSMTDTIFSQYFFANAKSRVSCAGTAIMAPVPTFPST